MAENEAANGGCGKLGSAVTLVLAGRCAKNGPGRRFPFALLDRDASGQADQR